MPLAIPARARLAMLLAPAVMALGIDHARAAEVKEQVLGDPAAPVTIIEYASLTCPHCAHFHRQELPAIKAKYIDTGKAKLIFRDFPLDQLALQAAVLAHCAGDDRYFKFLDAMFASQMTWARAADPVSALKQLAKLGGLSEAEADACLADRAMQDGVLQARLDGEQKFDVSSTPTLIIDGKTYKGGRDIDEISKVIDPLIN
ncbi:MAG TPA: DsbA family protein [Geminicoccaceae bacterium]|nr:DsbA family protein [Geminicoccus sp.]HMU50478.1 DsbA family protein [Geminicoccaceae bacterium]